MEALSGWMLAYIFGVLAITYTIRGTAGFGGINAPLLALVLPAKVIAPLISYLGLVSSSLMFYRTWRFIRWRYLWMLLPWCAVGSVLGLYVFVNIDSKMLTRSLGALVMTYGLYGLLLRGRVEWRWNFPLTIMVVPAGILAGFVGTLFGAMAGLFFAMVYDGVRMPKDDFRATVSCTLLILGMMRGTGYFLVDSIDPLVGELFWWSVPIAVAGVYLGNYVHLRVDQKVFDRIVNLLMVASGLALLLR